MAAYEHSGLVGEYGPGGRIYGSPSYSSSLGCGPIGPGEETRLMTPLTGDDGGDVGGGDEGGKGEGLELGGFMIRTGDGVTGALSLATSAVAFGGGAYCG